MFGSHRLQHFISTMRAAFVLCTFVVASASSSQQQALEPLTKYRRMSLPGLCNRLCSVCVFARRPDTQKDSRRSMEKCLCWGWAALPLFFRGLLLRSVVRGGLCPQFASFHSIDGEIPQVMLALYVCVWLRIAHRPRIQMARLGVSGVLLRRASLCFAIELLLWN